MPLLGLAGLAVLALLLRFGASAVSPLNVKVVIFDDSAAPSDYSCFYEGFPFTPTDGTIGQSGSCTAAMVEGQAAVAYRAYLDPIFQALGDALSLSLKADTVSTLIFQGETNGLPGFFGQAYSDMTTIYINYQTVLADLLIFVTVRPQLASGLFVKRVIHFSGTYKVKAIHFNFNILENYRATPASELFNRLYASFFEASLFDYLPQIYKTGSSACYSGGNFRKVNYTNSWIPARIQEHFDCSKELEAHVTMKMTGSCPSNSAGFDPRYFYNEYKTALSTHGSYGLTSFSFALLEGANFYTPDYSYAHPMVFGKGAGCEFLEQPCSVSWRRKQSLYWSDMDPLSTTGLDSACSYDARGWSTKDVVFKNYCTSPIPTEYRYFGSGWGGALMAMDYCPLVPPTTPCMAHERCFMMTVDGSAAALPTPTCYPHFCEDGRLYVSVTGGTSSADRKECPLLGGVIQVIGADGVTMRRVTCPAYNQACAGTMGCPAGCSNHGYCLADKCVCQRDFVGHDCSVAGSISCPRAKGVQCNGFPCNATTGACVCPAHALGADCGTFVKTEAVLVTAADLQDNLLLTEDKPGNSFVATGDITIKLSGVSASPADSVSIACYFTKAAILNTTLPPGSTPAFARQKTCPCDSSFTRTYSLSVDEVRSPDRTYGYFTCFYYQNPSTILKTTQLSRIAEPSIDSFMDFSSESVEIWHLSGAITGTIIPCEAEKLELVIAGTLQRDVTCSSTSSFNASFTTTVPITDSSFNVQLMRKSDWTQLASRQFPLVSVPRPKEKLADLFLVNQKGGMWKLWGGLSYTLLGCATNKGVYLIKYGFFLSVPTQAIEFTHLPAVDIVCSGDSFTVIDAASPRLGANGTFAVLLQRRNTVILWIRATVGTQLPTTTTIDFSNMVFAAAETGFSATGDVLVSGVNCQEVGNYSYLMGFSVDIPNPSLIVGSMSPFPQSCDDSRLRATVPVPAALNSAATFQMRYAYFKMLHKFSDLGEAFGVLGPAQKPTVQMIVDLITRTEQVSTSAPTIWRYSGPLSVAALSCDVIQGFDLSCDAFSSRPATGVSGMTTVTLTNCAAGRGQIQLDMTASIDKTYFACFANHKTLLEIKMVFNVATIGVQSPTPGVLEAIGASTTDINLRYRHQLALALTSGNTMCSQFVFNCITSSSSAPSDEIYAAANSSVFFCTTPPTTLTYLSDSYTDAYLHCVVFNAQFTSKRSKVISLQGVQMTKPVLSEDDTKPLYFFSEPSGATQVFPASVVKKSAVSGIDDFKMKCIMTLDADSAELASEMVANEALGTSDATSETVPVPTTRSIAGEGARLFCVAYRTSVPEFFSFQGFPATRMLAVPSTLAFSTSTVVTKSNENFSVAPKLTYVFSSVCTTATAAAFLSHFALKCEFQSFSSPHDLHASTTALVVKMSACNATDLLIGDSGDISSSHPVFSCLVYSSTSGAPSILTMNRIVSVQHVAAGAPAIDMSAATATWSSGWTAGGTLSYVAAVKTSGLRADNAYSYRCAFGESVKTKSDLDSVTPGSFGENSSTPLTNAVSAASASFNVLTCAVYSDWNSPTIGSISGNFQIAVTPNVFVYSGFPAVTISAEALCFTVSGAFSGAALKGGGGGSAIDGLEMNQTSQGRYCNNAFSVAAKTPPVLQVLPISFTAFVKNTAGKELSSSSATLSLIIDANKTCTDSGTTYGHGSMIYAPTCTSPRVGMVQMTCSNGNWVTDSKIYCSGVDAALPYLKLSYSYNVSGGDVPIDYRTFVSLAEGLLRDNRRGYGFSFSTASVTVGSKTASAVLPIVIIFASDATSLRAKQNVPVEFNPADFESLLTPKATLVADSLTSVYSYPSCAESGGFTSVEWGLGSYAPCTTGHGMQVLQCYANGTWESSIDVSGCVSDDTSRVMSNLTIQATSSAPVVALYPQIVAALKAFMGKNNVAYYKMGVLLTDSPNSMHVLVTQHSDILLSQLGTTLDPSFTTNLTTALAAAPLSLTVSNLTATLSYHTCGSEVVYGSPAYSQCTAASGSTSGLATFIGYHISTCGADRVLRERDECRSTTLTSYEGLVTLAITLMSGAACSSPSGGYYDTFKSAAQAYLQGLSYYSMYLQFTSSEGITMILITSPELVVQYRADSSLLAPWSGAEGAALLAGNLTGASFCGIPNTITITYDYKSCPAKDTYPITAPNVVSYINCLNARTIGMQSRKCNLNGNWDSEVEACGAFEKSSAKFTASNSSNDLTCQPTQYPALQTLIADHLRINSYSYHSLFLSIQPSSMELLLRGSEVQVRTIMLAQDALKTSLSAAVASVCKATFDQFDHLLPTCSKDGANFDYGSVSNSACLNDADYGVMQSTCGATGSWQQQSTCVPPPALSSTVGLIRMAFVPSVSGSLTLDEYAKYLAAVTAWLSGLSKSQLLLKVEAATTSMIRVVVVMGALEAKSWKKQMTFPTIYTVDALNAALQVHSVTTTVQLNGSVEYDVVTCSGGILFDDSVYKPCDTAGSIGMLLETCRVSGGSTGILVPDSAQCSAVDDATPTLSIAKMEYSFAGAVPTDISAYSNFYTSLRSTVTTSLRSALPGLTDVFVTAPTTTANTTTILAKVPVTALPANVRNYATLAFLRATLGATLTVTVGSASFVFTYVSEDKKLLTCTDLDSAKLYPNEKSYNACATGFIGMQSSLCQFSGALGAYSSAQCFTKTPETSGLIYWTYLLGINCTPVRASNYEGLHTAMGFIRTAVPSAMDYTVQIGPAAKELVVAIHAPAAFIRTIETAHPNIIANPSFSAPSGWSCGSFTLLPTVVTVIPRCPAMSTFYGKLPATDAGRLRYLPECPSTSVGMSQYRCGAGSWETPQPQCQVPTAPTAIKAFVKEVYSFVPSATCGAAQYDYGSFISIVAVTYSATYPKLAFAGQLSQHDALSAREVVLLVSGAPDDILALQKKTPPGRFLTPAMFNSASSWPCGGTFTFVSSQYYVGQCPAVTGPPSYPPTYLLKEVYKPECPTSMVGMVRRQCQASGSWGAVQNDACTNNHADAEGSSVSVVITSADLTPTCLTDTDHYKEFLRATNAYLTAQFASHSLAFVFKAYVQFNANKTIQLVVKSSDVAVSTSAIYTGYAVALAQVLSAATWSCPLTFSTVGTPVVDSSKCTELGGTAQYTSGSTFYSAGCPNNTYGMTSEICLGSSSWSNRSFDRCTSTSHGSDGLVVVTFTYTASSSACLNSQQQYVAFYDAVGEILQSVTNVAIKSYFVSYPLSTGAIIVVVIRIAGRDSATVQTSTLPESVWFTQENLRANLKSAVLSCSVDPSLFTVSSVVNASMCGSTHYPGEYKYEDSCGAGTLGMHRKLCEAGSFGSPLQDKCLSTSTTTGGAAIQLVFKLTGGEQCASDRNYEALESAVYSLIFTTFGVVNGGQGLSVRWEALNGAGVSGDDASLTVLVQTTLDYVLRTFPSQSWPNTFLLQLRTALEVSGSGWSCATSLTGLSALTTTTLYKRCPLDGNYPETAPGQTVYSATCGSKIGMALRTCGQDGVWGSVEERCSPDTLSSSFGYIKYSFLESEFAQCGTNAKYTAFYSAMARYKSDFDSSITGVFLEFKQESSTKLRINAIVVGDKNFIKKNFPVMEIFSSASFMGQYLGTTPDWAPCRLPTQNTTATVRYVPSCAKVAGDTSKPVDLDFDESLFIDTCPAGLTGMSTIACDSSGVWQPLNNDNCLLGNSGSEYGYLTFEVSTAPSCGGNDAYSELYKALKAYQSSSVKDPNFQRFALQFSQSSEVLTETLLLEANKVVVKTRRAALIADLKAYVAAAVPTAVGCVTPLSDSTPVVYIPQCAAVPPMNIALNFDESIYLSKCPTGSYGMAYLACDSGGKWADSQQFSCFTPARPAERGELVLSYTTESGLQCSSNETYRVVLKALEAYKASPAHTGKIMSSTLQFKVLLPSETQLGITVSMEVDRFYMKSSKETLKQFGTDIGPFITIADLPSGCTLSMSHATVVHEHVPFCAADDGYPVTVFGDTAYQSKCGANKVGMTTRLCDSEAKWAQPSTTGCLSSATDTEGFVVSAYEVPSKACGSTARYMLFLSALERYKAEGTIILGSAAQFDTSGSNLVVTILVRASKLYVKESYQLMYNHLDNLLNQTEQDEWKGFEGTCPYPLTSLNTSRRFYVPSCKVSESETILFGDPVPTDDCPANTTGMRTGICLESGVIGAAQDSECMEAPSGTSDSYITLQFASNGPAHATCGNGPQYRVVNSAISRYVKTMSAINKFALRFRNGVGGKLEITIVLRGNRVFLKEQYSVLSEFYKTVLSSEDKAALGSCLYFQTAPALQLYVPQCPVTPPIEAPLDFGDSIYLPNCATESDSVGMTAITCGDLPGGAGIGIGAEDNRTCIAVGGTENGYVTLSYKMDPMNNSVSCSSMEFYRVINGALERYRAATPGLVRSALEFKLAMDGATGARILSVRVRIEGSRGYVKSNYSLVYTLTANLLTDAEKALLSPCVYFGTQAAAPTYSVPQCAAVGSYPSTVFDETVYSDLCPSGTYGMMSRYCDTGSSWQPAASQCVDVTSASSMGYVKLEYKQEGTTPHLCNTQANYRLFLAAAKSHLQTFGALKPYVRFRMLSSPSRLEVILVIEGDKTMIRDRYSQLYGVFGGIKTLLQQSQEALGQCFISSNFSLVAKDYYVPRCPSQGGFPQLDFDQSVYMSLCPAGQVGMAYRACDSGGSWASVIQNSCYNPLAAGEESYAILEFTEKNPATCMTNATYRLVNGALGSFRTANTEVTSTYLEYRLVTTSGVDKLSIKVVIVASKDFIRTQYDSKILALRTYIQDTVVGMPVDCHVGNWTAGAMSRYYPQCPAESTPYALPKTDYDVTVYIPQCPSGALGMVSRKCQSNGRWAPVPSLKCVSPSNDTSSGFLELTFQESSQTLCTDYESYEVLNNALLKVKNDQRLTEVFLEFLPIDSPTAVCQFKMVFQADKLYIKQRPAALYSIESTISADMARSVWTTRGYKWPIVKVGYEQQYVPTCPATTIGSKVVPELQFDESLFTVGCTGEASVGMLDLKCDSNGKWNEETSQALCMSESSSQVSGFVRFSWAISEEVGLCATNETYRTLSSAMEKYRKTNTGGLIDTVAMTFKGSDTGSALDITVLLRGDKFYVRDNQASVTGAFLSEVKKLLPSPTPTGSCPFAITSVADPTVRLPMCPAQDSFPSTVFDTTLYKAGCASGSYGMTLMRCGSDATWSEGTSTCETINPDSGYFLFHFKDDSGCHSDARVSALVRALESYKRSHALFLKVVAQSQVVGSETLIEVLIQASRVYVKNNLQDVYSLGTEIEAYFSPADLLMWKAACRMPLTTATAVEQLIPKCTNTVEPHGPPMTLFFDQLYYADTCSAVYPGRSDVLGMVSLACRSNEASTAWANEVVTSACASVMSVLAPNLNGLVVMEFSEPNGMQCNDQAHFKTLLNALNSYKASHTWVSQVYLEFSVDPMTTEAAPGLLITIGAEAARDFVRDNTTSVTSLATELEAFLNQIAWSPCQRPLVARSTPKVHLQTCAANGSFEATLYSQKSYSATCGSDAIGMKTRPCLSNALWGSEDAVGCMFKNSVSPTHGYVSLFYQSPNETSVSAAHYEALLRFLTPLAVAPIAAGFAQLEMKEASPMRANSGVAVTFAIKVDRELVKTLGGNVSAVLPTFDADLQDFLMSDPLWKYSLGPEGVLESTGAPYVFVPHCAGIGVVPTLPFGEVAYVDACPANSIGMVLYNCSADRLEWTTQLSHCSAQLASGLKAYTLVVLREANASCRTTKNYETLLLLLTSATSSAALSLVEGRFLQLHVAAAGHLEVSVVLEADRSLVKREYAQLQGLSEGFFRQFHDEEGCFGSLTRAAEPFYYIPHCPAQDGAPSTPFGDTYYYPGCPEGKVGMLSRLCDSGAKWQPENTADCLPISPPAGSVQLEMVFTMTGSCDTSLDVAIFRLSVLEAMGTVLVDLNVTLSVSIAAADDARKKIVTVRFSGPKKLEGYSAEIKDSLSSESFKETLKRHGFSCTTDLTLESTTIINPPASTKMPTAAIAGIIVAAVVGLLGILMGSYCVYYQRLTHKIVRVSQKPKATRVIGENSALHKRIRDRDANLSPEKNVDGNLQPMEMA